LLASASPKAKAEAWMPAGLHNHGVILPPSFCLLKKNNHVSST
jgi:hypothetical protein